MKIETWLPVFPGFYNTIFEPPEDAEIDDINSQRELNGLKPIEFDDIEFDYREYNERVATACVGYIEDELSNIFKNKISIEMQKVNSPREYNFHNDSIDVVMKVSRTFLKELKKYLKDNYREFSQYIKDSYTGYDGFISSYSNNPGTWMATYLDNIENNGHYLGSLLEFVCQNEDINEHNMFDSICSETYLSAINYQELTEKA